MPPSPTAEGQIIPQATANSAVYVLDALYSVHSNHIGGFDLFMTENSIRVRLIGSVRKTELSKVDAFSSSGADIELLDYKSQVTVQSPSFLKYLIGIEGSRQYFYRKPSGCDEFSTLQKLLK